MGISSLRAPKLVLWLLVLGAVGLAGLAAGCSSNLSKQASAPIVAEGEHDPAVWGEIYPLEYEQWLATQQPRPAGKSLFKRGFDGGVMFDKLSQYPFMPVLFNGWGFGIDYKEPRGHYYMIIDQQESDPSRVKAGGGCITCKSPYAEDLQAEDKSKLFSATYDEGIAMIPAEHRQLGATCIDCHDNATMKLQTRRWTAAKAREEIGLSGAKLTNTAQRIMVCGQCHATYSMMKDANGASIDVDFPWEGSKWGAITVENIIKAIEEQTPRHEWVQSTTGMKLGYIRHPDVEFYAMTGSPHFNAGVGCPDCHMPPTQSGNTVTANHNIMSPLKADMAACKQCHTASAEEMRNRVIAIQQTSLTNLLEAGYRTATVAKLFELANRSLETTVGDPAYDEAAAHYRQAFYRVVFMGAENSVGFHNPTESARILTDARKEAETAEAGLRALLASKKVPVPGSIDLELPKYLNNRGIHKLNFNRAQYIYDPSGTAEKKWTSLNAILK